jgi:hypothetical protein
MFNLQIKSEEKAKMIKFGDLKYICIQYYLVQLKKSLIDNKVKLVLQNHQDFLIFIKQKEVIRI